MCRIILPIKKKYSKDLLSGIKTFEMRRNIPKRKVDKILIYETSPTSMVVGILTIKETLKMDLPKLWKLTKDKNSLSKKEFYDYFKDKKYGYAYVVSETTSFEKYIPISDYGFKYPPQGFVYNS